MHDRSDYKLGWQLEREEKEAEVFTTPVVTRFKHYFCEKCALDNYRKSQRCFECGNMFAWMKSVGPLFDSMDR